MLEKEKLDRLNTLAKRKKANVITDEELSELESLREQYLKNFRKSMKNTIENSKIIDPEGNDVTPEKVKQIKRDKQNKLK
ncbi:DUF896 domain-containing protein [Abyssicoccus albus]|uniref:UPF0291 protein EDD62_0564 n=1 Tax=Abyssicoccus albus TaxID=1817405 RepID=A0A1Q1G1L6_9BACL|nr:DUF896 domain-containing protein [Abyssicoccus albus]AQL56251.1 hypothetical protein BVH56_04645 [Abyssicoccus albus]RPF57928.1 uncharacterized protein YnzC (UPF0291/DUF896 family) [Abyssicoccus albus]